MADLKTSLRVGGPRAARPRTEVPAEAAAEFIRGVAEEGGVPLAAPTEPPKRVAKPAPKEKTREIHVRIPLSLHRKLAYAAVDRDVSLTQIAAEVLALGIQQLDATDS